MTPAAKYSKLGQDNVSNRFYGRVLMDIEKLISKHDASLDEAVIILTQSLNRAIEYEKNKTKK